MAVRLRIAACVMLMALAACARAQVPSALPDLRGGSVLDGLILDAARKEVGTVVANLARGARVKLTPDGGLILGGQVHSETVVTLNSTDPTLASGYVFETQFIFTRPEGFYAHMIILSPRVGAEGAGYRITYRFCSPCPVAANNTGFFLVNTASEEVKRDPLNAKPIAGAPYRLAYGRQYIAYTVVRDLPQGVNLRFYLHDTTVTGDDERPLFEYTDESAQRIRASGAPRVQVGCGGLIHPAAVVWFGGMRIYPLDRLDEARRQHLPAANVPLAELAPPPAPRRTELPNIFSDNMVLQQGKPVRIWGHGLDGDQVTVTLGSRRAQATVAQGRWQVELDPLPAGGPYELTVSGKDRTVAVRNVRIGEVWVLGGQSNMSWWLSDTTEAETEVPASDFPDIREFSGWHPAADDPQFDVAGGSWKVVSPVLGGRISAVGYYFAKALHQRLGVPIGLVNTSTPGTGIECWMSGAVAERVWGATLHQQPGRLLPGMGDPSCYFNGKVAPVMPLSVSGFVWYQGDGSNSERGYAYRRYIPALIDDWRQGFDQGDLPFLIVQIPRYRGCSPEMRESQLLAALGARNAGIAVVLDVGEPDNIHPRNKRPVGERLALIARALAYGEKIEYMGPIYQSMDTRDGKAYLTFTHVGSGLELRGEGGFEVCGPEGQYVPAHAALCDDGRRVVVWSDAVPHPQAVRYAWAPVPEFSLYNREGLLASPFRTREG